jgi:hypothetical protein
MDGQLAQTPHDLKANRYRASLVTHELPGLPAAGLLKKPGRLLVERLRRIAAEEVDSALVLAAEVPGLKRCGQVTGVGFVELIGEALKCRGQVSGEIPDRPRWAPRRKALNGWISCGGEVAA